MQTLVFRKTAHFCGLVYAAMNFAELYRVYKYKIYKYVHIDF